jgi:hypothetical protein
MKHPQPVEEIELALAQNGPQSMVLDPQVLEHLYQINRIYLDFLAADHPHGAQADSTSTDIIMAEPKQRGSSPLANLAPAARLALARCPFSLFTARFHDGHFWAAQAQINAIRDSVPRFWNPHKISSDATAFSDLALFYAWHLVHSNPLAARVLLGMAEQTLATFKQLPLLRLQQLAVEQPQLVTLRWPERSPFWRGLTNLAQRGIEERLTDMRLLGIQMIASELAGADSST